MSKPRGRPPKKQRTNLSGLRNVSQVSPPPSQTRLDVPNSRLKDVSVYFDSTRINWEKDDHLVDSESDNELPDTDLLRSTDLTSTMIDMGTKLDHGDDEWLPPKLRKKEVKKTGRPSEYKKGPDDMDKAPRTRRRHRKRWEGQTRLDSFVSRRDNEVIVIDDSSDELESTAPPSLKRSRPASLSPELVDESHANSPPVSYAPSTTSSVPDFDLADTFGDDLISAFQNDDLEVPIISGTGYSTTQPIVASGSDTHVLDLSEEELVEADIGDIDGEVWEDELDENVQNPLNEPRTWDVLRTEAREHLKKQSKILSSSQINQLIIISNFATLRLKGYSRMEASRMIAEQWRDGEGVWFARRVRELARHYQIFEELPKERRGGIRMSRSWLHDEVVQSEVQKFLNNVPAGKVTAKSFLKHINDVIFPGIGITPAKPLSLRTAQRWLIKLGWRYSTFRKGVYMDGHERDDVVRYRNDTFLPMMEKFEARMVHYNGPELERIEPVLGPGELEIIPLFHDECCFHANDMATRGWHDDGKGKRPIRKKGRGRLIHVSDFLNPENGRLIVKDNDGNITHDARQIIFPGANGDPWWDTKQFLAQIEEAIKIFELAHPGKQALFIFDQSSAHAALPPDALKAFEMNKSDGGKQRKQKDTIIPMSNPDPEFRGKPQAMTLPNGHPKGLERVLEERGFNVHKLKAKCSPVCPFENQECCMARLLSQQEDFVNQPSMIETLIKGTGHECIFLPKFHCELNPIEMYWGWCKYRYREADKKTFEAAKKVALQYLDACPIDVIRRFINRSWRFMSAYRLGLTGKAAEWAVRRQKRHRVVSEAAMRAMESILPRAR